MDNDEWPKGQQRSSIWYLEERSLKLLVCNRRAITRRMVREHAGSTHSQRSEVRTVSGPRAAEQLTIREQSDHHGDPSASLSTSVYGGTSYGSKMASDKVFSTRPLYLTQKLDPILKRSGHSLTIKVTSVESNLKQTCTVEGRETPRWPSPNFIPV